MSTKKIILSLLALSSSALGYSQDLINRIPEQAEFVAVINSQAIIKHSSFEKINELLNKFGAFEAINAKRDLSASSIQDLDIDYDRNSYIYKTHTDSAYYIGTLIPLKKGHKIDGRYFADFTPVVGTQGYEQVSSANGKTQIAWNDNSLFILTGDFNNYYFQNDSVAARYGMDISVPAVADYSNLEYDDYDSVTVDSSITEVGDAYDYDYGVETYADTVVLADGVAYAEVVSPPVMDSTIDSVYPVYIEAVPAPSLLDTAASDWSDYSEDDSYATDSAIAVDDYAYDYDNYTDENYQTEMAKNVKNDSIRNAAFSRWIAVDFPRYFSPAKTAANTKTLLRYNKQNTLVHFWVKDLDDVYQSFMPYDLLTSAMGVNFKNLNYGYKDAVVDLVQEDNKLSMQASVGLDKDLQQLFAKMYKSKVNRKFAKYIPESHLGYLALTINTEAYLKSLPTLFDRWYAPMVFKYEDLVSLAGTAIDIAFDEKALAKVMRGDHVLFINDLKKVQTSYIDYEYDEDYNYKQVTKTKEEEIPNFLWMFTAEDQRIYKKLLAFAVKEQVATEVEGLYRLAEKEKSTPFYILFKDDIVFVGNDQAQLQQIQENRFKASRDASVKKQIFANTMTATVHTAKIPEVINKLGVPMVKGWDKTVGNLADFGDISFKANGLKKNRIEGEFSIAFPKNESNALQYLLQQLVDVVDKAK